MHKAPASNNRPQRALSLPVFLFEEENIFILYCPALELTGYGETEFEAWDSFKTTTQEYIAYTTQHGTLKTDLTRLGWHVV